MKWWDSFIPLSLSCSVLRYLQYTSALLLPRQGPVSVYRSGVMLYCWRPALSHGFSSFQVLTSPSCHDLSSKYEVRGSRPAQPGITSSSSNFLLYVSDGSVIQWVVVHQRGRVQAAAGAMTHRAPPQPASDQDEMIILGNGDADHHQGINKNITLPLLSLHSIENTTW